MRFRKISFQGYVVLSIYEDKIKIKIKLLIVVFMLSKLKVLFYCIMNMYFIHVRKEGRVGSAEMTGSDRIRIRTLAFCTNVPGVLEQSSNLQDYPAGLGLLCISKMSPNVLNRTKRRVSFLCRKSEPIGGIQADQ